MYAKATADTLALFDSETIESSGTRYHYLTPLYAQYYALFNSLSDDEAAQYDPRLNPCPGESFADAAAFAEANNIDTFVDLVWMCNATISRINSRTRVYALHAHKRQRLHALHGRRDRYGARL